MFETFLSRLAPRARTNVPETKSGMPLIALQLQARAQWTPRDYAGLAREGLMKNAVVYRCVRMIAEGAASVPFLLYDGDSEIESHPLLALLRQPNPAESGPALFERWYAFLQCAGNSYLEALSLRGAVRELHLLRPDRVRAVPGARGWPQAYEHTVEGRTTRIAREAESGFLPVLHMTLFHPLDDHYGLSPIEAAAVAIDVHNEGANWTKALLDNAARPSGALIYKGADGSSLSAEQFARLKRELEDAYQGAANAGRPMVLEGGLDWRAMSHTPADMDFAATRDVAAREIALAFGVPPMLLGIPGDNTYSNYQEANRVFWRATVLPLAGRIGTALTQWLAPAFGTGLVFGIDTDRIEALSPDRTALWDRVTKAPFLTVNEKRAAIGYGAVTGGDVLQN